jgi:hypothetical protein
VNKRQVPTTNALRTACESEEVLKFLAKTPREKERDRAQWLRLMLPVMAEGRFHLRERGAWTVRRGRK